MILDNQLPFTFISKESRRDCIELTCKAEMSQNFTVPRLMQRIVEGYVSVKERIKLEVKKAINKFGYNIINLNMDLWKPYTGGYTESKKYSGVRIYFTNSNWELFTYFLAICEFNPFFTVRTSGETLTKVSVSSFGFY